MAVMRLISTVVAVGLIAASCGSDDDTSAPTTTATTATTAPATTTTIVASPAQPAIWPANDVVYTTPNLAAADFVEQALTVPPVLGEFIAGDARSGEIEVFSAGETNARILKATLLLRQLGPNDGWFVLGAVSALQSITAPPSGAEVTPGPLTITGLAVGFEASVNITAFIAGHADQVIDTEHTMAGGMGVPEPFSVTLDLSSAPVGATVVILVRGGVGLETDPGDFAALPIVIANA